MTDHRSYTHNLSSLLFILFQFEESILQHHARAQIYDVLRAVQDQICGENQTNNARRENQVPETSQLQLVPLGLGEHHD